MQNMKFEELWDLARQYGKVRVTTCDDGKYYACIEFNTILHTEMKVASTFNKPDIRTALIAAVNKAEEVVESISKTMPTERKLLPRD